MEDQTVVLRRGAQVDVVGAAAVPREVYRQDNLTATLALGRIADLQIVTMAARLDSAGVFRARTSVDGGAYVISLEAVGAEAVARSRHGVPAPSLIDGFGISNLALVDARLGTNSMKLDDALLPTLTIVASARFGI